MWDAPDHDGHALDDLRGEKAPAERAVEGTVPSKVLQEWTAAGFPMPDQDFLYKGVKPLKPIAYKNLDLNLPWESFDLAHELTTKGIQKFVADYQSTLRRSA